MSLPRLLRTVRHLRPIQIYGRVAYRLHRPTPDLRPPPSVRARSHDPVAGPRRRAMMLGPTTFKFLNVVGTIDDASGWDDRSRSRLWRYNLHYFDDLNAEGAAERNAWHRALLSRWIRENPAGQGPGWEPYPTSLRIVNWIKWAGGGVPDADFVASLAVQTRWLTRRLERHILGNHLWANGKALAFAGVFFEGNEADAWLRLGTDLLDDGLREQILPDGGHFELSPMYSAIVLEDVLDLINLATTAPRRFDDRFVARLRDAAARMLRWLRIMTHPDGRLAFFNDCAFGVALEYGALAAYASLLNVPVDDAPLRPIEALPDSGYVRLTRGQMTLVCDLARVGPDYLPGHAHADTLSFELSHGRRRICVNSGTSTYDVGVERLRQRGTAAHNTVVVDARDSSEIWASFRVGRRARPRSVAWGRDERTDAVWASGAHDGYGRTVHARRWTLGPTSLRIEDRVDGKYGSATARFHLAPDVLATVTSADSVALDFAEGRMAVRCNGASVGVLRSTWHPEFGAEVANQVVVADVPPAGLRTEWSWT